MIPKQDLDRYLFMSRKKNAGEQMLTRRHGIKINLRFVEPFLTKNHFALY